MSEEKKNYRMERIERLLHELEYEVIRGMMEGEIDETLQFRFIVPMSKSIPDGIVGCHFVTRPAHRSMAFSYGYEPPTLKVVK